MSPIRMGSAAVTVASPEQLSAAATALSAAVDAGGVQLPGAERGRARAVVDKVAQRSAMLGAHTVVALAGATGSGKSSLFNALVGAEVATVGVRRPTTSAPVAAVWGEQPAGALLDWLGVGSRHHVERDPADRDPADRDLASAEARCGVGSLDGLVLLDLPDLDSRALANRAEAARVLELVDLFVWVTDPQKYADARLHDEHVSALATHEAVTMVVLNQVDRLAPADADTCRADLARLMKRDGVSRVSVLATSARTGVGVGELRQRVANVVASRSAARARLAADVRAAAIGLGSHVADAEPVVDEASRAGLVDALARSAGVPLVVEAVDRDYRVQAAARTGWPVTRWVHRLRTQPLRRLRLDGREVSVSQADVRSVLWRSSLPPPTPAARAAVSLATRRVAERAGAALPVPWADAVERAAAPADASLGDALDQAVVGTSLARPRPWWWRVVGMVQNAVALTAAAGLLWLLLAAVLGWFRLGSLAPETPSWGPLPVPFVLVVGGVAVGLLLALVARWLAQVGGRRRASAADVRLRTAIGAVADDQALAPVRRVLERHAATRAALRRAAEI